MGDMYITSYASNYMVVKWQDIIHERTFSKQGRKGTQSVFLKQDFNNMIGNKETGMIF